MSSGLSLSRLPSGQKASETGQNGSKVKIYLLAFVLPPYFGRPKGAKSKDIFENGAGCKGAGCLLSLVTGAGGGASYAGCACLLACPLGQLVRGTLAILLTLAK